MHVLIDSSSTISFIFGRMVTEFRLTPVRVPIHLVLNTVIEDNVYHHFMCEKCIVEISRHEMAIDLRVLEFLEFDVLLGMDWLTTYHAHFDFFHKTLFFDIPGCSVFTYTGTSSRLPLTRGRLATGEEMETLAETTSIEARREIKLEKIPVVCEFSDMFPDDLPRVPPPREIDFVIDLVPRTKTISFLLIEWL
ncbi:hypothetical protein Syun_009714 [Stephania yunnanensis]|uniref:Uncharacterized protein n=1 Tax=Stephania yunnanensis TaxID=152371 RepID=A0AAP0PR42_9MAGN